MNYESIYNKLEQNFIQYYNISNRQKLLTVKPLIQKTAYLFEEFFDSPDFKLFSQAYGEIMNKVLLLNKIIIFKYNISQETNQCQFISILSQLTYPSNIVLTITDNKFKQNQMELILKIILSLENVTNFEIIFDKNYISYTRKAKKLAFNITQPQTSQFLSAKELFYITLQTNIDNYWFNYETFEEDYQTKHPNIIMNKVDLNLSFTDDKQKQFEDCINYLSECLKTSQLKIVLFKVPNFSLISKLISKVQPKNLCLIPYKDVQQKQCDEFLNVIYTNNISLRKINIINCVDFSTDLVKKFITSQINLEELRISGMLKEEIMERILKCYLYEPDLYKIKVISFNGKIRINQQWSQLICDVLTVLTRLEALHVDVHFNGTKYMKNIAEAFYKNTTLKSFTVRNTVRHERDVFVDVLKEYLYETGITREEVFKKIRLYKLL